MDIHLKEAIPKVFQPIHKAVQNEGIKEVVAKGGRGSGKSSYLSLELLYKYLGLGDRGGGVDKVVIVDDV